MLFSSIPFLFYFLPCVFVLYFLVPMRWKNTVLLLASLFFYAWGEPKFVVFMLASIVQGYVLARLVEKYRADRGRAKLFLTLSLVFSLGLLGYCKYADFFLSGFNALTGLHIPLLRVALPIGISFYTFQILSYVVDVYRGDVKAQRNFIDLAAYVAMFPQLIAGPIVRYSDIASQLEHRTHSLADVAAGARRFVLGLGKKVLLANVFYELITTFKASDDRSVLFYWLYAAACVLNIYFDFSGYSDMAIGLGRIFGFRYLENFDYPYISASITEFWRRWHMSLGSWFRDYVYIPLGGNRVSKTKWLRNILIVWLLTGLWHGAKWNYIAWGLYHGVLICMSTLFEEPLAKLTKALRIKTDCISWEIFRMLRTFILCVIGRLIFMGQGIRSSIWMIRSMVFDHSRVYNIVDEFSLSGREWRVLIFGCLLLLAVSIAQEIMERRGNTGDVREWLAKQNIVFKWLVMAAGLAFIAICGVYGSGAGASFIYEQF